MDYNAEFDAAVKKGANDLGQIMQNLNVKNLTFLKKAYPIGLKIKSKPVGIVGEFIGDVVGYTRDEMIVRDYKTDKKWVRSQAELQILEDQD